MFTIYLIFFLNVFFPFLKAKLEAEFQSIQHQHEEQLEIQLNDLQNVQDDIVTMAYDVEEIRRGLETFAIGGKISLHFLFVEFFFSKASLEVEIIIYRQLLESSGIKVPMIFVSRIQPVESGSTGRIAIKKQKKGPIGIRKREIEKAMSKEFYLFLFHIGECASNGTYISLVNYSTNQNIDISGWVLKRHSDTGTKIRYVIPDGVRLEPGRELRIYTKSNWNSSTFESILYKKLVNNNLVSWGM